MPGQNVMLVKALPKRPEMVDQRGIQSENGRVAEVCVPSKGLLRSFWADLGRKLGTLIRAGV